MKLKLTDNYGKLKKGTEIEIDAIVSDLNYVGGYKVRLIGIWKKPKWLSISFVVQNAAQIYYPSYSPILSYDPLK